MENLVVLFSHGSLVCGAGRTLQMHAERLGQAGDQVEIAYLNYSEPRLRQVVDGAVAQGIRKIEIVPYFLVEGRFVTQDLPREIAEAKSAHPHLDVSIAGAIGKASAMSDAITELAAQAVDLSQACRAYQVPLAVCRGSADCPLFGSELCPKSGGESRLTQEAAIDTVPRDQQALLVVAHGSPRPESNEDVEALLEVVREQGLYKHVQMAYLDCNSPTIPEGVEQCLLAGVRQVVVVPYFLHIGKHVARDVPAQLAESGLEPGKRIVLAPYVGQSAGVTAALKQRLMELRSL